MSIQVARSHYFKDKYLTVHRFISYYYQVDAVRKSEGRSVLFIGVGDSIVTGFLKQHPAYEVTTVDIDPALSPDVVGDIRALPFPDRSFDMVCAFEVLEHLPFAESRQALKELARVSRTRVLISVPHRRSGFEMVLRFPGIRTLLKREFVRIPLLFPIRFPGFAESGQHHWEIDGRTTTLSSVREALLEDFTIDSETTPVLDSYLRFFALTPKHTAELP